MHETKMEAAAPGELAGRQRTEEREQDVFFRREGLKQQPFGHEGIAAVRGAVADGATQFLRLPLLVPGAHPLASVCALLLIAHTSIQTSPEDTVS